jgi:hypothetical protein
MRKISRTLSAVAKPIKHYDETGKKPQLKNNNK